MYDRISNRLKHNSNLIYSCLWWVITFSSLYAYYIFFYYLGQPNLLNEELLCKEKDMIRNSALEKLKSFRGSLEANMNRARNILKPMQRSKRKGTTGKFEPLEHLYVKK